MRKVVQIRGHGPLQQGYGKEWAVGWEDVWLKWSGKPGRKRYYAAPCLISKSNYNFDMMITNECQSKHPELDYSDDLARGADVLKQWEMAPFAIDTDDCPNIYTQDEEIDRREAERMILFYLEQREGLDPKNIKLRWVTPKHLIIPFP